MAGGNFTQVKIGDLTVYYSYSVPIAFQAPNSAVVARANEWSVTTGGHLSKADGGTKEAKKRRLPGPEWEKRFKAELGKIANAND